MAERWSSSTISTSQIASSARPLVSASKIAPPLTSDQVEAMVCMHIATLARFQVTGGPGSNMVFRPPNPIKVDVLHLIGGTVDQVKLMLVDQHGLQIDSLLGEKFSCVLVIESE